MVRLRAYLQGGGALLVNKEIHPMSPHCIGLEPEGTWTTDSTDHTDGDGDLEG